MTTSRAHTSSRAAPGCRPAAAAERAACQAGGEAAEAAAAAAAALSSITMAITAEGEAPRLVQVERPNDKGSDG